MTDEIKTLQTALRNAVEPEYDIDIVCPHCGKEGTTDNGEWLLWCGEKEHAKAILDAARRDLDRMEKAERYSPEKWHPIDTLPDDVTEYCEIYGRDDCFVFNSCNGPDHVWLMAAHPLDLKHGGVWTHWTPTNFPPNPKDCDQPEILSINNQEQP